VVTHLKAQGIEATWTVLGHSPYFAIAAAAEPADLLVMISHGRGGVLRWLLGSVADKLVREAPAPVLPVPSARRGSGGAAVGG
jgi:nucleotide-binding universal stress UspA family protein